MRVTALYKHDLGAKFTEHMELLRLRRRASGDRLDRDVTIAGDMEIDHFDTANPVYLAAQDDAGLIVGGVRLLDGDGETMIRQTFPELLEGHEIPRGAAIYESSRFCVDAERAGASGANGLRIIAHGLLAGMVEWALRAEVRRIVTVADLRLEASLARAGWPLERIGGIHRIETREAVAGYLEVSPEAAQRLRERVGLEAPVFDDEGQACGGMLWRRAYDSYRLQQVH